MENPTDSTADRTGPVLGEQRIASLDVLRGLAVLGILIINIQVFALPGATFRHPHALGVLEGSDHWVWLGSYVLAAGRFWALFAMLFGAGVVLMAERRRAAGRGAAGLHHRRMGVLLVIGLLHGYVLWYGDILHVYAIAGLILFLLRRLHPAILIGIGTSLFVLMAFLAVRSGHELAALPTAELERLAVDWTPTAERVEQEALQHRGALWDQIVHRARVSFYLQTRAMPTRGLWLALSLMCFGMALYRLGVLTAARSRRFYAGMLVVGLLVGVPLSLYGVHRNDQVEWAVEYSRYIGAQYNAFAVLPMAAAWVAATMLLCKSARARVATAPLAAVGRMALSNYLLQTVICTTLLYGHGFGLFGRLDRTALCGVVAGIWILQLVVSPVWLRHFRFGPAEWCWRAASYLRLPPMRRGDPPSPRASSYGGS